MYIGGRYYDPATGRFLTPGGSFDPYNPRTLNPYVPWQNPGLWLMAPLAVLAALRMRKKGKGRRYEHWLVLLLVVGIGMSMMACGEGGGGPGGTPTPPQTPGGGTGTPGGEPGAGGGTVTPGPSPQPESPLPTPCPTPTPTGKTAYLTFDDGPEPQHYTKQIAERLASLGMEATFFLTGADPGEGGMQRIHGFPDDVRAIRDNGHAIGIHGWFHLDWTSSGYDYLGDVEREHEALLDVLGGTLNDKLIRAPGGAFPEVPFTGYEDWYYYLWTMPEGDPKDGWGTTAEELVTLVREKLGSDAPDGLNLLLHSPRPGTYKAIVNPEKPEEDLIQALRDLGYTQFRKLPRPEDTPGTILH